MRKYINDVIVNGVVNDVVIKKYQFTESDGKIRDYFWFDEKDYVVVLEKVLPNYWLITAHIVDDKRKHQKRFQNYMNTKNRK